MAPSERVGVSGHTAGAQVPVRELSPLPRQPLAKADSFTAVLAEFVCSDRLTAEDSGGPLHHEYQPLGNPPLVRTSRSALAPTSSSSGLSYADVIGDVIEAPNPFAIEGRAKRASDEAARRASEVTLATQSANSHIDKVAPRGFSGPRISPAPNTAPAPLARLLPSNKRLPTKSSLGPASSALPPTQHSSLAPNAQAQHLLRTLRSSAPSSAPSSRDDLLLRDITGEAKENHPPSPRRQRSRVEEWRAQVHHAACVGEGVAGASTPAQAASGLDAEQLQPAQLPAAERPPPAKAPKRATPAPGRDPSPPKRRSGRKRAGEFGDDNVTAAANETGVSTTDLVAMLPKRAKRFGTVRENEEEGEAETDYDRGSSPRQPKRKRAARAPQVLGGVRRRKQRRGTDSESDTSESLRRKEATRKKWAEVDSFALEVELTL